ncbi:MAG: universal stress protein [Pseudomonadales bacterium]
MLRKILFATDLGPFTSQVLEHVTSMSAQNGASTHILHVVDPVSAFTHNLMECRDGGIEENYAANMNTRIRQTLMQLLESEYQDGNEAVKNIDQVDVLSGLPSALILQHSQEMAADLIVLGSHSNGFENPEKLGSVAAAVLRHSSIPVYLVPIMKSQRLHISSVA